MLRATLVTLLVGLSGVASAQREIPLAQAGVEYVPSSAVDNDSSTEIASARWHVGGLVPLPLNSKTTLLFSPRYQGWRFSSSEVDDRSVHDINLSSTLRRQLSERWALNMTLALGLASDFRDVDSEHLRITGAIAAERVVSPSFRFGFGLAGNYNFGEFLPLPVLIADWQASERVRLFAFLPQVAGLGYRAHARVQGELRFLLVGNRFSLESDNVSELESISVASGMLEGRVGVRIRGPLWLFASLGYTAFRRLELFDQSEETITDLTPERALVGALSLEVRIPIPTKH